MNADVHDPIVWSLRGSEFVMLACGKQFLRGKIESESKVAWLEWPVAIQLRPQLGILFRVKSGIHEDAIWDTARVPSKESKDWKWPFLRRSAATSLAEAWKTVSDPKVDWQRRASYSISPDRIWAYKSASIGRNLHAWLAWDSWNKAGYSLEQRTEVLRNLGFKCGDDALRRAAEERGL